MIDKNEPYFVIDISTKYCNAVELNSGRKLSFDEIKLIIDSFKIGWHLCSRYHSEPTIKLFEKLGISRDEYHKNMLDGQDFNKYCKRNS